MPSRREIIAALFGSWRLMRFDADGMNWFNLTIQGFWRSFFAALPVAPFFALLVYFDFRRQTDPVDVGREMFVTIVVYAVGWTIVPVIMVLVTKLLGTGRNFVPMMVAYNWTTVPQIIIQALAALPGAIGLISVELSGAVLFTVVIYILVFEWFVIRIALQTTAMTAAGIVLLLETVGVLINLIAYG